MLKKATNISENLRCLLFESSLLLGSKYMSLFLCLFFLFFGSKAKLLLKALFIGYNALGGEQP